MSFPSLIIKGSNSVFSIQSISIVYDNSTGDAPTKLVRDKYDVKRITRNSGVGSGTANKYPDVVYDEFRTMHSWYGHVDVITESVTVSDSSTDQEKANVYWIKNGIMLDSEFGIYHTNKVFSSLDLGPNKPNLGGTYVDAFEQAIEWVYEEDETEQSKVVAWLIRDISITDNQNNSSRVSFHFECISEWNSIGNVASVVTNGVPLSA